MRLITWCDGQETPFNYANCKILFEDSIRFLNFISSDWFERLFSNETGNEIKFKQFLTIYEKQLKCSKNISPWIKILVTYIISFIVWRLGSFWMKERSRRVRSVPCSDQWSWRVGSGLRCPNQSDFWKVGSLSLQTNRRYYLLSHSVHIF